MLEADKFSIITVCFNCEKTITKTMESVLNQSYDIMEYIIVDGKSTDSTMEKVNVYQSKFELKMITCKVISEPDLGIYDAMNKAIAIAKGKWLNFMNAGDIFFNRDVLSDFKNKENEFTNKVLVYGYNYLNNRASYPKNVSILKLGVIMANHQSMFFNKHEIKSALYYNLKYPIYADYELVNKLHINFGEDSFQYIHIPIAIYEGGGVSSKPSYQKRKDKYLILFKYYGFLGLIKGFLHRICKFK